MWYRIFWGVRFCGFFFVYYLYYSTSNFIIFFEEYLKTRNSMSSHQNRYWEIILVDLTALGLQLDSMILSDFSKLNDSKILWFTGEFKFVAGRTQQLSASKWNTQSE